MCYYMERKQRRRSRRAENETARGIYISQCLFVCFFLSFFVFLRLCNQSRDRFGLTTIYLRTTKIKKILARLARDPQRRYRWRLVNLLPRMKVLTIRPQPFCFRVSKATTPLDQQSIGRLALQRWPLHQQQTRGTASITKLTLILFKLRRREKKTKKDNSLFFPTFLLSLMGVGERWEDSV